MSRLSRGNRGDVSTAVRQGDFVGSVVDELHIHGRSTGPEEGYDNDESGSNSEDANSSWPARTRPKPSLTVAHRYQSTLPSGGLRRRRASS
jgi:hypothetical protein